MCIFKYIEETPWEYVIINNDDHWNRKQGYVWNVKLRTSMFYSISFDNI